MNSSGLLTRWIDAEGAKDIMVAAGIIPHEIPIHEFCVSRRDREEYLYGLLGQVAYAVAQRSATANARSRSGRSAAHARSRSC